MICTPRDWQQIAQGEALTLAGMPEANTKLAEAKRYGACADEIERLRSQFFAVWTDDGIAVTLAAAAEDADEWLALIERLHDAGRWKFSEADSRQKLRDCRKQLRTLLMGPNVKVTGDPQHHRGASS